MPWEDPDPEDPMVRVAVALPGDEAAQREMAWAFAEEFARLGYSEQQILGLFRHSFYAGAHHAFQCLGEETILDILRETVGVWGRVRLVDREPVASPETSGEEGCHE